MLTPVLLLAAFVGVLLVLEFIALPLLEDSSRNLSMTRIRLRTFLCVVLAIIIYVVLL